MTAGDDEGPRSQLDPEDSGHGDATRLGHDERREVQAQASPEGLVAILFTDDVGSTRVRQRLGDQAAQERMREHNVVVREQIAKHDGHEVKTMGDGFMVVFSDVAAALASAMDIQQAVAEDNEQHPDAPIEVRMGLNAGQAIKEEEDFFGGAVVVAARLQGLAKGGQILVSEAVRVLAGLPEGIGYVRQGRRRLKGLEGSYDIWRVPWRQELSTLARLRAKPAYRVAAAVLVLAAIGAGVAGVVLTSSAGGGDSGEISYQELRYHYEWQDNLPLVPAGDCQNEDLVDSYTATETPVAGVAPVRPRPDRPYTGDFVQEWDLTTRTVLFSADDCRTGFFTLTSILRDSEANDLYITDVAPLAITLSPDGEYYTLTGTIVETVTGGTGVYEGARGGGTCSRFAVGAGPGTGPRTRTGQGDCVLQVTTEAAAQQRVPLGAGIGASPSEVAIFGSALDQPTAVEVLVAYSNGGTDPLTGLVLRVVPPEGTQVLTVARGGEDLTATEGERVWSLPDLPPVSDVQTFQFTLTFLASDRAAVQLTVEIDSEGFDEPVRTEPVVLNVVQ